ncbi:uncharacterized protein TRIADDRAFT_50396 [Trichoplax adhaerens]|uniref:BTB domain-containing protein n=1 Tax=Trichoplax adhaerens TaxID=10228 RepID=B3RZB9_TRIAD|nr:hypothetical protein TRIADDRAFT_50396 [Trichoplax adhaerens]EDV23816.1 hypothetical protein TRIADDRAFT_50396 [Trichoplax adhaerens]|eukprot:XP_002113342.1 hypothetical protein TRIADDRAFT_50396 [Trichoplax adhaerens]
MDVLIHHGIHHTNQAFSAIGQMKSRDELCDVELIVDGNRLKAHKLILASFSPYFHAMFTSQLAESQSNTVTLHDIDFEALKTLVDYTYTSVIDINQHNVQVLLSTASMLQMNCVRDSCCKFLKTQLHPSNCLGIIAFADTHSCNELHQLSHEFALGHFKEVIQSEEYVLLSYNQVESLISSDVMNVDSEECVFQAVMSWIDHDRANRQKYVVNLIQHVRLPLVSRDFLLLHVETNELIRNCNECKDLLIEAMRYQLWPEKRSLYQNFRTQYRRLCGTSKVAISIGGGSLFSIHSECEIYDINRDSWIPVASMAERRARLGVAVINNTVYAIGGYDGGSDLNSVECYLPQTNTWTLIQSLGTRRSGLGVAVTSNLIFAIGGYDGALCLNSVERYDPLTNQWSCVADLNSRRRYVRGATLNDCIYAIGGFDGGIHLASVECYDLNLNQWKQSASMLARRSSAGVTVVDNILYVCGGNDGSNCLRSFEKYDPEKDEWISLPPMNSKRSTHDVIAVDGWIYAIGGNDGSASLSSVEKYSIAANKWYPSSAMNMRRSSVGVAFCEVLLHE